ncbi:MAG: hypothetical protein CMI18_05520 [Opitutaceae bacterium]|nr:hypothetical protein [Opitutaceae bacterium]
MVWQSHFKLILVLVILSCCFSLAGAENTDWNEATALAVLASDTEKKARACQALAVVGGPESVPTLAVLLNDEGLASYARTALEVIDDPAAGAALRSALPNLDGRLLTGVITSLGVRGDTEAVPALRELVGNSNRSIAGSALVALARIGTEDSMATVVAALNQGPEELRIAAAHAVLFKAEQLMKSGNADQARELGQAVSKAVLPDHILQAASAVGTN